jgi:hypothetical protein
VDGENKKLSTSYWGEKIDPGHHSKRILLPLVTVFEKAHEAGTTTENDFYKWMEDNKAKIWETPRTSEEGEGISMVRTCTRRRRE